QALSISNSKIGGSVPSSIATPHRFHVDVSLSEVSSEIPSELSNAVNLQSLHIASLGITKLPDLSSSFTKLTSLRIGSNELENIPNFSLHANKANLAIHVSNNKLDFADLEPNFTSPGVHPFTAFTYELQNPIPLVSMLTVPINSELKI